MTAIEQSRERLVVIVPCYNEEATVRSTVDTVRRTAGTLEIDVDILLIDDGSTDDTRREIESLCAELGCRAMYNEKNLGVGRSLLRAYDAIEDGSWVTIMPGDSEIDFDSIRNFLAHRREYDLILGYLQNPVIRPLRRRLLSAVYMKTVQTLYGFPFRYLNGMKLFRVDIFRGIPVYASGHAFNSELIAKAVLRNPRIRIGEAPFVACGRPEGFSKAIRPRAVWQAIYEVYRGWRSVSRYRAEMIARGRT